MPGTTDEVLEAEEPDLILLRRREGEIDTAWSTDDPFARFHRAP